MKWKYQPRRAKVLKFKGLPWLAGWELHQTWRLSYLEVSMEKGVTDHAAIARVRNAMRAINRLRKVGLNVKGFYPATSAKIFKMLIRTKWEYTVHLTMMTKPLLSKKNRKQEILDIWRDARRSRTRHIQSRAHRRSHQSFW